jgi:hypothetical protein
MEQRIPLNMISESAAQHLAVFEQEQPLCGTKRKIEIALQTGRPKKSAFFA